jgi:hypothetical protein
VRLAGLEIGHKFDDGWQDGFRADRLVTGRKVGDGGDVWYKRQGA